MLGNHSPARAVIPVGHLRFGYSVAINAIACVGVSSSLPSTSDLCDRYQEAVHVVGQGLKSYGKRCFVGTIETVRVGEDNTSIRQILSESGESRVLVVDGGGIEIALLGDNLASIA